MIPRSETQKITYHGFLSDVCISDLHRCMNIGSHCRSLQITCTHLTPLVWISDINTEVLSMVYFKWDPIFIGLIEIVILQTGGYEVLNYSLVIQKCRTQIASPGMFSHS